MTQFLSDYKLIFLTLHILSMAIGLGGATISDILFFKFLRDYRVSKKEEEVLHIMKDIILAAIFIIALSGFALYVPRAEELNASPMFLVKAVATGVVIANGIALHLFIAPYLIHLNLRRQEKMTRGWQRLAFALGAVSVCSWYTAFFIAMLKEAMPFSFSFMLTLYLCLLFTAVATSQILEWHLAKKAAAR